ncbi:YcfA family protein [Nodularia sp. NIES-3585]|nr:YcfA family protein [Nodularia sp. NIES-3585]
MRYIIAPSSLAGRGLGVGFLYLITSRSAVLPSDPITISGKDGDDAKVYIEKEVAHKLAKLKLIEKEESEE